MLAQWINYISLLKSPGIITCKAEEECNLTPEPRVSTKITTARIYGNTMREIPEFRQVKMC